MRLYGTIERQELVKYLARDYASLCHLQRTYAHMSKETGEDLHDWTQVLFAQAMKVREIIRCIRDNAI